MLGYTPMLTLLQLTTLFLVALTMVCSVGHALEFPGKMRLSKDAYLTAQSIYYPGFTFVGGFAEVAAPLMTLVLLFLTPRHSAAFMLTLWTLIALAANQIVFWIVTQPVNRRWPINQDLRGFSEKFFGTQRGKSKEQLDDWVALRNRWEYSHLARSAMASAAFVLLATAIAVE